MPSALLNASSSRRISLAVFVISAALAGMMLIQLYGRGETSALSVSVASAFVLILGSALTLPGRVAIHSFVIAITGTFSLIVVVGLINPGTPAR